MTAKAEFATVLNIPPMPDIGNNESVGPDTQVNLAAGGTIGNFFGVGATDGSSSNVELNITGGTVGAFLSANHGSTINISGGLIDGGLDVQSGSTLHVSGGTVLGFDGFAGSNIEISGGLIVAGARTRGSLQMSGGSIGNDFQAQSGSRIEVSGGVLHNFFDAHLNSHVSISGGIVGNDFDAMSQSQVDLLGGSLGERFQAQDGSAVYLLGGQIGNDLIARSGSMVHIGGTAVGDFMTAEANSTVQISDGSFGTQFTALNLSNVNLIGSGFKINGVNVPGQLPGSTIEIGSRDLDGVNDVTLTGVFADGSDFSFNLNAVASPGSQNEDLFEVGAMLTATIFDGLLGDYNENGSVDTADYAVWLATFGQDINAGAGADGNFDGKINELDYHVWKNHFSLAAISSGNGSTIPEPGTGCLLGIGFWILNLRRARPQMTEAIDSCLNL